MENTYKTDYNYSVINQLVNLIATTTIKYWDTSTDPNNREQNPLMAGGDYINSVCPERRWERNDHIVTLIYYYVTDSIRIYGKETAFEHISVDNVCHAIELLGYVVYWYD